MVCKPAIELRHLLRAVILNGSRFLSRLHKAFVAEYHLLNKAYRTSDKGNTCKFVFIFQKMSFFKLCFNSAVGQSECHCNTLGAVHHNALHKCLSADADFVFFRHLRFPPLPFSRFLRLLPHQYPIHPQAQHGQCQT